MKKSRHSLEAYNTHEESKSVVSMGTLEYQNGFLNGIPDCRDTSRYFKVETEQK